MNLSHPQNGDDLIVLRRQRSEPYPRPLPDGFEDLAPYNLMIFRSHHEVLDVWALCELIGHYVNYRKKSSPSPHELLPESDFKLIAVCVRYPEWLAQHVRMTTVKPGVYEVPVLTQRIRIIVIQQLPHAEHNSMLHLFSAQQESLRYAKEHYPPRSTETGTLLYEIFKAYQDEGATSSEKLQQFVRESLDKVLATLPPEELRKRLSVEERLKGLSAEEVVKALPPETLEELTRQLKGNGSSSKPQ